MKSLSKLFLLAIFAAVAVFGLIAQSPKTVLAVCSEGDTRLTETDCQSICSAGTCVQIGGTGGPGNPIRYQCTSCPDPTTGTCTTGTPMTSATFCNRDCTLAYCVADTAGVNRCCSATPAPGGGGTSGGGTPITFPSISSILTGLGWIPTEPGEFAEWVIKLGIGLGTVLAVIFLIIGGYGVATSGGNPENLEKAKEQITAAIAGLLFILLSVLILNIIGGDIIGISF